MFTGVKNFTKYTVVEGAGYWMFTSPVTYDTEDNYTLPTTISQAGNSELDAMEHFYIDGISFDKGDFIIENWNMDVASGCNILSACNFNPNAIIYDGSCIFPEYGYNCEGNCLLDSDNDNVCDPFEILGCADQMACNTDYYATENDGTCIYPGETEFIDYTYNFFSQGSNLFSQGTSVYLQGSNLFTQGTNLLYYTTSSFLNQC